MDDGKIAGDFSNSTGTLESNSWKCEVHSNEEDNTIRVEKAAILEQRCPCFLDGVLFHVARECVCENAGRDR